MKRVVPLVAGLLVGLCACGSGAPRATLSTPAPSSSLPTAAKPSPSDSNPAAMLADGTRIEITSGGGGTGSIHVTLKITAGPGGLHLDALQIRPVDAAGEDPWPNAQSPQFYNPAELSSTITPPDPLPAGASMCMVQQFSASADATQAPASTVFQWNVTIATGNGQEKASMPDGGGAGPDCNVD